MSFWAVSETPLDIGQGRLVVGPEHYIMILIRFDLLQQKVSQSDCTVCLTSHIWVIRKQPNHSELQIKRNSFVYYKIFLQECNKYENDNNVYQAPKQRPLISIF